MDVMSRADSVLHSARHGRPEGRDEGKCQEEGGTETRPPASDIQWREILWSESADGQPALLSHFLLRIMMTSMLLMRMMN